MICFINISKYTAQSLHFLMIRETNCFLKLLYIVFIYAAENNIPHTSLQILN